MTGGPRVVDSDTIADRYDRRYDLHTYDGVRETLHNFLTPAVPAAAEVGCGTGYWVRAFLEHASTLAKFAWAESFEADRIEVVRTVGEVFANGTLDRAFTSQLTVLTDDEFNRGVQRIAEAQAQQSAPGPISI